jgi:hypothetical protein
MRGAVLQTRAASVSTVILAVLTPKCPLCVAAVLSGLGLGAAGAGAVAPFVRPFAFLLAGLALLSLARAEWRRRRAVTPARTCCGG